MPYTDRQKRLEYLREYRRVHPESAESRRKHAAKPWVYAEHKNDPVFRMNFYRQAAKKAGRVFALPKELVRDLMTDRCFYCGDEPSPLNGIDRVDNARGYEIDNVVAACARCNRAKRSETRRDFEAWMDRAAKYRSALWQ